MHIKFNGEIWYWRGPAPFFFVTVPKKDSSDIKSISKLVTYGWGVIPVDATIGDTKFHTALFPKGDEYALPLKADVRKAESLIAGDRVEVEMEIGV